MTHDTWATALLDVGGQVAFLLLVLLVTFVFVVAQDAKHRAPEQSRRRRPLRLRRSAR